MRFITTTALLASVSLTAAQTTTNTAAGSSPSCAAQLTLDACLSSLKPQADACESNDWVCLCQNYQKILTCYNNCPDDAQKSIVQTQVTQYCEYAAPILSSSSLAAKTASSTSNLGVTATSTAAGTSAASSTDYGTFDGKSTSASQPKSSSTGAAGIVHAPAGGVLAAALGIAAML